MGFLTTKELNQRQVRWVKILTEYYFEIEYIKGINNTKADIFSRKAELQSRKKLLGTILCKDKNGKIRYNYPQILAVYKVLIASWI
jgi:hypothetical protein